MVATHALAHVFTVARSESCQNIKSDLRACEDTSNCSSEVDMFLTKYAVRGKRLGGGGGGGRGEGEKYYPTHLISSHLGFVHPLQDVALHQCLPSSSVVAFLIQVVPSFSVMSSCHLLLGRPLDLFPLLGCHSVHRLVHLLSFNLAI